MIKQLKVTSFKIRDILGAREVGIEPGLITILSGSNGTGKSTILESIKGAIGGGNIGRLARIPDNGEEEVEPEVVLVLDDEDGEEHYQVEKNTKSVRVRKRVGDTNGFEDVPQPQRWLTGLFDGKMANPIDFLKVSDKERVLLLLEALPIELNRSELWEKLGIDQKDIGVIPDGMHPLQELAFIRDEIFNARTGVNRDQKQKAASAEQLKRATPANIPDDLNEKIEELDRRIQLEKEIINAKISETKNEFLIDEKKIIMEFESWSANERALVEKKISDVRDEVDVKISGERIIRDNILAELFSCKSEINKQCENLAVMREQEKSAEKAKVLKEQTDEFEKDSAELLEKSEQLTTAIENLDLYRRSLADNLPIHGLEVQDKTILVDGIPFEQLNTARRIEIAVKISCLRARKSRLPIVWVDGAEALDRENFSALCESLQQEGVQSLIGRVEDHDFAVVKK